VWFGVDPLAEKAPGWNPFRYGFNNPIRMIDPTGMNEIPPEGFSGDSWCDKDGCFNKIKEDYYQWTGNDGEDKGVYYNKSTEVNPKRSLFSSIGEKMKNIMSRVTGIAFESDMGRFNSEEIQNADYGEIIDNLLAVADAMKSVQGVSNPLGPPENNEQAVKQLGEIADWGADGGNILYNLLPSYEKSKPANPNPWGPKGGNDTFDAIWGHQLHDPKFPGLIVRYDSGGVIVPYKPK
jgi:hypothetical protein